MCRCFVAFFLTTLSACNEKNALNILNSKPVVEVSKLNSVSNPVTAATNCSDPLVFPLEIHAFNINEYRTGFTKSISFQVSDLGSNPNKTLIIRGHRLGFSAPLFDPTGAKISVQLNGSSFIDIKDNSTELKFDLQTERSGGIHGAFNYARVFIPLNSFIPRDSDSTAGRLRQGCNTLTFKFNKTDGISSAARILSFDIREQGQTTSFVSNTITMEDPSSWNSFQAQGYRVNQN